MSKPKKTSSRKPAVIHKYGLIVADPPWAFTDKLTMSDVKRGAEANYPTLNVRALIEIGEQIERIAAPDAVLALWVPSALLQDGLNVMKAWGFEQKQIYTWVKIAKSAAEFADIEKRALEQAQETPLGFGMGRYFRGCTEHALIGSRGKAASIIESKSERNVELAMAMKHSAKPEGIQDRLERMLPDVQKLELFARRERKGWTTFGNECPGYEGVDVREWLNEIAPPLSKKQKAG